MTKLLTVLNYNLLLQIVSFESVRHLIYQFQGEATDLDGQSDNF